ncbi:hypothetical protein GCM10020218_035710 [Dactylosporangium vinaceum]
MRYGDRPSGCGQIERAGQAARIRELPGSRRAYREVRHTLPREPAMTDADIPYVVEHDTNYDGHDEWLSADTNADGRDDVYQYDLDGDGNLDNQAWDSNHDGYIDARGYDHDHNGTMEQVKYDTDKDGKADLLQVDSDGDGYLDRLYTDSNHDGQYDRVDQIHAADPKMTHYTDHYTNGAHYNGG